MNTRKISIVVCPTCQGYGRIAINANTGEVVIHPVLINIRTFPLGWDNCARCDGQGTLPVFSKPYGPPILVPR
jgi:hypothetical protein